MLYPKNVQIPYDLFLEIIDYMDDHQDNDYRYFEITKALNQKLESIYRHVLYSAYKVAPTEKLRAEARQRYLDLMGVPSSFRWGDAQDESVNRNR